MIGPKSRDLVLKSKGIEARGVDTPQGFVVRAGSTGVKSETASIQSYLTELRQSLVNNGVFSDNKDFYQLSQDYTFSSPSTAAGVLLGRSADGRTEWKNNKGRTLKEMQEAEAGVS